MKTKQLYLDLMKRILVNSIYGPFSLSHPKVKNGLWWPPKAHTMIGWKRLSNIQECFENVLKDGVEGDLIETGVWRGGATIFMQALVKAYDQNRKVYVADSFDGLPKPDPLKYPVDSGDNHWTIDDLKVSFEEVVDNFRKYDLLDENVFFVKGYFKDTIPDLSASIGKLSILRLDGDMFSSTIQVFDGLYDKLSVGGYLILDDYNLTGAREAMYAYRKKKNITSKILNIDNLGVYWRKE